MQKRWCETCDFHEPGPTACTGYCRNRDWQPLDGTRRQVRDRETACYRGWGIDSWRPKRGGGPNSANGAQGPRPGGGGGGGTPIRYPGATGASPAPVIPLHLLPPRANVSMRDIGELSD